MSMIDLEQAVAKLGWTAFEIASASQAELQSAIQAQTVTPSTDTGASITAAAPVPLSTTVAPEALEAPAVLTTPTAKVASPAEQLLQAISTITTRYKQKAALRTSTSCATDLAYLDDSCDSDRREMQQLQAQAVARRDVLLVNIKLRIEMLALCAGREQADQALAQRIEADRSEIAVWTSIIEQS